jgi:hypothetical protein
VSIDFFPQPAFDFSQTWASEYSLYYLREVTFCPVVPTVIVMRAEPAPYRSFGMLVSAPGSGSVVQVVDGLPDTKAPECDRHPMAGNRIFLHAVVYTS